MANVFQLKVIASKCKIKDTLPCKCYDYKLVQTLLEAIWQFVSRLLKMIIPLIKTSFLETYSGYLSRNVEKSAWALKYYQDINKSLFVIL